MTAVLESMARGAQAAYNESVAAAAAGEAPPDLPATLMIAGKSFPDFQVDVDRAVRRQRARADLQRADELDAQAAEARERVSNALAKRQSAEAKEKQRHQTAMEKIRETFRTAAKEADDLGTEASRLRAEALATLRATTPDLEALEREIRRLRLLAETQRQALNESGRGTLTPAQVAERSGALGATNERIRDLEAARVA